MRMQERKKERKKESAFAGVFTQQLGDCLLCVCVCVCVTKVQRLESHMKSRKAEQLKHTP